MARANRLNGVGGDGGIFHLTHRCHNRAFLLKFACDRDAYRMRVWEHLRRFDVWVLDYCVTSNHVHLLVDAPERFEIGGPGEVVLATAGGQPGRGEEESGGELGGENRAGGCQPETVLNGKLGGRKPPICGTGQTADLIPARD